MEKVSHALVSRASKGREIEMNWTTLLWVIGIVILFLVVMRGCGGMMGGCGMASRRRSREDEEPEVRRHGPSGPVT